MFQASNQESMNTAMSGRKKREVVSLGLQSLRNYIRVGERHSLIGEIASVAKDYLLAAVMPKSDRLRRKLVDYKKRVGEVHPIVSQVINQLDAASSEIF